MYSGKCDLGDTWGIHDNSLDGYKIYIGDNIIPLDIKDYHDALPYFPFLVSMSSWGNGHGIIRLTSRSYVDIEERERLETYYDLIRRYYNKCKRKKVKFDVDECIKACSWSVYNDGAFRLIAEEFEKDGLKAKIPDVHLSISDYYRKNLYDDMVAVGWDEFEAARWCFGWNRAFQMLKLKDDETDEENGE